MKKSQFLFSVNKNKSQIIRVLLLEIAYNNKNRSTFCGKPKMSLKPLIVGIRTPYGDI